MGFDFRPRSFNFLQQYRFLELVEKIYSPEQKIYLRYENEKDFIVSKMLDDVQELLLKKFSTEEKGRRICLEFSDLQEKDYYEAFNWPFYWHYQNSPLVAQLSQSPGLKGIILPYSYLHNLHETMRFQSFVSSFFQIFGNRLAQDDFELILEIDWNSNIFPSLFEFFDFSLLSLPVNEKIETHYRNVDLNKIKSNLPYYKQILDGVK